MIFLAGYGAPTPPPPSGYGTPNAGIGTPRPSYSGGLSTPQPNYGGTIAPNQNFNSFGPAINSNQQTLAQTFPANNNYNSGNNFNQNQVINKNLQLRQVIHEYQKENPLKTIL